MLTSFSPFWDMLISFDPHWLATDYWRRIFFWSKWLVGYYGTKGHWREVICMGSCTTLYSCALQCKHCKANSIKWWRKTIETIFFLKPKYRFLNLITVLCIVTLIFNTNESIESNKRQILYQKGLILIPLYVKCTYVRNIRFLVLAFHPAKKKKLQLL